MSASPANADTLLRIAGLGKTYAAPVLVDLAFDLRRGEVHALVGENGAGKSTLARILAGLTQPDRGEMWLHGSPYAPRTKREAAGRGVHLVMQELNLVANLTVAENIFLDAMPHRAGWIDYRRMNGEAGQVLDQLGLGDLDPRQPVQTLGIGQQQLVEIAAGLWRRCALLILDEPTAALTDPEIARLFGQIDRLRSRGVGILYISHRLEEIRQIADRTTVLRDGRIVATRNTRELALEDIVRLMVGRDLEASVPPVRRPAGAVALAVRGLCRGARVREISFEAHRGEILGFAGLMGAGRTEVMRAIFGADRPEAGQVFLHGARDPAVIRSPRDAVRLGIALLTEDRKGQGLFLPLPVRGNITLPVLGRLCRPRGWVRGGRERAVAARWVDRLAVHCRSVEQRVQELSGGNQQKIVMAKWLERDCDILIFDEPTRGIDVGAKFEIYRLLAELAERGKAILMVSSDLKELMTLCDRIVVISAGRVAGTFCRGAWTQDQLMAAALRGYLATGDPRLS
jgi:ribose transport system ATP-binding protein